jgi:hypothetical protein
MKFSSITSFGAVIAFIAPSLTAFAPHSSYVHHPSTTSGSICSSPSLLTVFSTMADSGVPPTESAPASSVDDAVIPTKLPSDVGFDYVPLAGALASGDLVQADQVCRNVCFLYVYIIY